MNFCKPNETVRSWLHAASIECKAMVTQHPDGKQSNYSESWKTNPRDWMENCSSPPITWQASSSNVKAAAGVALQPPLVWRREMAAFVIPPAQIPWLCRWKKERAFDKNGLVSNSTTAAWDGCRILSGFPCQDGEDALPCPPVSSALLCSVETDCKFIFTSVRCKKKKKRSFVEWNTLLKCEPPTEGWENVTAAPVSPPRRQCGLVARLVASVGWTESLCFVQRNAVLCTFLQMLQGRQQGGEVLATAIGQTSSLGWECMQMWTRQVFSK